MCHNFSLRNCLLLTTMFEFKYDMEKQKDLTEVFFSSMVLDLSMNTVILLPLGPKTGTLQYDN